MADEVDPVTRHHPMVLAAQARLARQGGWERILAGEPLAEADVPDGELLVAAGVLAREGDRFLLAEPEFHHHDPEALAAGNIAYLRRALRYAQRGVGWSGDDPVVLRQQGSSSALAADMIAEQLARMPGPKEAFARGEGRLLDVGVGVAAISLRVCELFPGATAVGIDVLPEVLEEARRTVAERGCEDRVELRLLDVADLADEEAFDLAWVPQPFLSPATLEEGLARVHAALQPDGWLVMPINAPVGAFAFDQALTDHTSYLLGGGPMTRDEAETVVASAGYEDLAWEDYHGLSLLLARRPAAATVTRLSRRLTGADRTHGGRRVGQEHGVEDPAGARSVGD